jgi:ABC-type molybdate transport system permease subunit
MLRQTLNTSPLRVKTPLVLPKLWQSRSVASYILSFLRKERLGEKGGALLAGETER